MLNNTVDFLREIIQKELGDFEPEVGIVLGSGLGELADEFCQLSIPYSEIPNFEASQVSGHKSRLVFAEINGKKVVMMQGRFHYYEGHPIQKVVFPIKVMKKLGVKTVILTNAAGGVNPAFNPSDLMIITDHINHMNVNPLIGPNDESMGNRFPDMSEVYSPKLVEMVKKTASKLGIDTQEGVYMALTGPSYETPAEVKMARIVGADAVGMSTVPEAIVAKWADMEVIGISCICNSAAGVSTVALSHNDVIHAANIAKERFKTLVKEVVKNL
ncbi:MAG: purine-nucleoside phosphorylase [Cyanobacteria bacterium SIG28]|nr:purine-nucleoside phosphorylase [Cyanobacteria bacterium SIG28]